MLNFALADIDGVVHLKEDWLALTLVCFFALQVLDQVIKIVAMHKHVEGHVVDCFSCGAFQLDAVLCQIVSGLLVRPIGYLMKGWHERLERYVPELVSSQSFQCFLRHLFEQDRSVYLHLLISDLLVLNHLQIQQGLVMLLVV